MIRNSATTKGSPWHPALDAVFGGPAEEFVHQQVGRSSTKPTTMWLTMK
jgi:hypothetical protein